MSFDPFKPNGTEGFDYPHTAKFEDHDGNELEIVAQVIDGRRLVAITGLAELEALWLIPSDADNLLNLLKPFVAWVKEVKA